LSLGIFYHRAESREGAVREITPWHEEHVRMFGPLGFVPGITSAQLEASTRRGGWGAAGVPTVLRQARRLVRRAARGAGRTSHTVMDAIDRPP
jgi:hypothetical protein